MRKKLFAFLLAACVFLTGCGKNESEAESSDGQHVMNSTENAEYDALNERYSELLAQHILLNELKAQYEQLKEKGSLTEDEQLLLTSYEKRISELTEELAAQPSPEEIRIQMEAIANGG